MIIITIIVIITQEASNSTFPSLYLFFLAGQAVRSLYGVRFPIHVQIDAHHSFSNDDTLKYTIS